jgi:hypothetical protein
MYEIINFFYLSISSFIFIICMSELISDFC